MMKEVNTRYVLGADPAAIANPYEKKAMVAMRTKALEVIEVNDPTAANALLFDAAAIGAAPTATYEDLIFHNPLDREVFVMSADPEQAEAEADFYIAHREIEDHLADAIDALPEAPETAPNYIDLAKQRVVKLYRGLGTEAFAGFRPFFTGLNGYAGPSGLFSAAIPTLDMHAHGGVNISSEERERMLHDLEVGLYPSHQSEALTDLLINGSQLELSPAVTDGVVQGLNKFRSAHRASVKRFLPGAIEGDVAGSGGETDVANYLASKAVAASGDMR